MRWKSHPFEMLSPKIGKSENLGGFRTESFGRSIYDESYLPTFDSSFSFCIYWDCSLRVYRPLCCYHEIVLSIRFLSDWILRVSTYVLDQHI